MSVAINKTSNQTVYLVQQVPFGVQDNMSEQNQEIKFSVADCQATNHQMYMIHMVTLLVPPDNLASYRNREMFEMLIDCLLLHYF